MAVVDGVALTTKLIIGVSSAISEYAFGKFNDNLYNTFSAKRKIRKILSKDKKFIKNTFQSVTTNKGGANIASFLLNTVFQSTIFLYPASRIPENKKELLWGMYSDRFCHNQEDPNTDIPAEELCGLLVECVDYHNKLVRQYLLSESERTILDTINNNHSDLLGYIGKTLDSDSELQLNDAELDYAHRQIEGVIHALRMDLRHYKLLFLFLSLGIIIFSSITVLALPNLLHDMRGSLDAEGVYMLTLYMAAVLVIVAVFSTILCLILLTLKEVRRKEARVSNYMELLWELHFRYYRIRYEWLIGYIDSRRETIKK